MACAGTAQAQAPTAGSVTTTVAANSTANAIALALSGGTATSVAVASQPSHGTATASGTSITYTPAPGYFGSDSFTYTAANTSGTSAPATVTITVPAIILTPSPASGALPGATVGTAYSQTLTTSGGASPYTYSATGLPPGVILSTGGVLSGTPTAAGSYTVSVSIADANGTAGSASYTIAVAAQPPVANAVSTTVAANSSANPITLSITGGTATSVAVASQPSHGTATASGTSITYTPAPGYFGSDSFTYTAANTSGTSAPATVTITVPAIILTPSPASGALPGATVGTAYSQTLTTSGGASPYTYSATGLPPGVILSTGGVLSGTPTAAGSYTVNVSIADANGTAGSASYTIAVAPTHTVFGFTPPAGTLPSAMAGEPYQQAISAAGGSGMKIYSVASGSFPDGMILNVSTGALNGPLKPNTEGDYSFTIAVTDSSGATSSASYTLKVKPRAVTVTDKAVTLAPGDAPPNVYLNEGATGGPFVMAEIGRVTPADAGTAQIIEGEVAALDDVRPKGFYLKFTPNPLFTGSATIDYTLTSALGISNTGVVSYTVALDRQAVAGEANRVVRDFVGARQSLLANHVKEPGLIERHLANRSGERATLRIAPSGNGVGVSLATSTTQLAAARRVGDPAIGDQPMPLFNFWFEGTILAHKQGGSAGRADTLIGPDNGGTNDNNGWGTFSLLSAGADYLVTSNMLLGLAVHSDRMTDPGNGTHVEGTGMLTGPYASIRLAPSLYLDASLLYGRSWNDVDLGAFGGSFDTTRLMATTKLEGLLSYGPLTFRPSVKLSYLTEKVDDFDVGNDVARVAVEGFTQDDLRASAGLRASYRIVLDNGWRLSPEVGGRVGVFSSSRSNAYDNGLFGTVEAGFSIAGIDAWTLSALGTFDVQEEGTTAVGARMGLAIPF
ncbi:Ig-like domain-containing protein [Aureimonas frigidaquae]|uniref:Autotransporter domain-containing protein n=1 Tax=Aureimonas frigidaquae TaxID=424757 RepID=A0A0P0Z1H9_9HYPH|nr:putative Ig domain-containing protein [Aureimonas frigidaquae]BAT27739.1 hypothetical protein [Aureimonas frigidaquae]